MQMSLRMCTISASTGEYQQNTGDLNCGRMTSGLGKHLLARSRVEIDHRDYFQGRQPLLENGNNSPHWSYPIITVRTFDFEFLDDVHLNAARQHVAGLECAHRFLEGDLQSLNLAAHGRRTARRCISGRRPTRHRYRLSTCVVAAARSLAVPTRSTLVTVSR